MPITYDGTTITIDYSTGDLKGNSWANPFKPEDIYQASIDSSWNIVEKNGITGNFFNQYNITKKVNITGSDTYFDMSYTSVIICDPSQAISYQVLNVYTNFKANQAVLSANNRINVIGQRTAFTPASDTSILLTGFTLLSADTFSLNATAARSTALLQNCILMNINNHYHQKTIIDNVTVIGGSYAIIPQYIFSSCEKLTTYGAIRGILAGYGDWTISNFRPVSCTYDVQIMPNWTNRVDNLIDSFIDTSKIITVFHSINKNANVYFKTTFNVICDIADVTIKLYDASNNLIIDDIFSNDYTNTITYYDVDFATGPIAPLILRDIRTTYEPFTLVLSKDGYDNLTVNNIVVTPGYPTIIRADLVPETPPVYYNQQIDGSISLISLSGTISQNNIEGIVSAPSPEGHIETINLHGEINSPSLTGDIY